MSLMDMFSNMGSDPWANLSSALFGTGGAAQGNQQTGIIPAITGVVGGIQGLQNNTNTNNQVQAGLGQNQTALQGQIDALNGQIAQNRQQAQDMYQRSLADVTNQNSGIQGNINTQTANLNALSDPNSPYMQMARQAIERKDAAAGRNSQWGDRETQLAGTLADYVGKYSPGISQSIEQARNQISQNNQGLASLYAQANAPADRNTLAQIQAIQQQIANANAQNQAGRQAQAAASNSQLGLIKNAGQAVGGIGSLLGNLFGGNGGSNPGVSSVFQGNQTPSFGNDWMNQTSMLDNSYTNPVPQNWISQVDPNIGANYSAGSNPYGYTSSMSSNDPWDLLK